MHDNLPSAPQLKVTLPDATTAAIHFTHFDTPLQIAYAFCQQNQLQPSLVKTISDTLIAIIQSSQNQPLQHRYSNYMHHQVPPIQFKNHYHLNELIRKPQTEIYESHPMLTITNSLNLSNNNNNSKPYLLLAILRYHL